MTAGQYRNSPDAGNFMNIYPGGLGYDRLTGIISLGNPDWRTEQIDRARNLPFAMDLPLNQQYIYGAVPEPATTTAIAGSIMLAAAGFIRRRRRATTVTKTASV
jgi:MYXO-CTERM domain-containing protein